MARDHPAGHGRPLERPSQAEVSARQELEKLFLESPLAGSDLIEQISLYLRPQLLSHILALSDIYQKILDVHGVVLDLGTRYGRNMVTFSSLRRIYEPYNYFRKIVGFDTFSGFPEDSATVQDGIANPAASAGTFGTPEGYADYLARLLRVHEQESPMSHIVRYEIRSGNIESELPSYFRDVPETIVALAYFDLDLYRPTKSSLQQVLPYTTKGSILAFDQPTHRTYPGETIALTEVLDLHKHQLRRCANQPYPAYIILE